MMSAICCAETRAVEDDWPTFAVARYTEPQWSRQHAHSVKGVALLSRHANVPHADGPFVSGGLSEGTPCPREGRGPHRPPAVTVWLGVLGGRPWSPREG